MPTQRGHGTHISGTRRPGLTLVEIVVVLVILVALAGLLLPMFGNLAFQSETNASMENLRRLQEMIINRYVPDMKGAYLTGANAQSGGSTSAAGTPGANPDGLPRLYPNWPPQFTYLFIDPNAVPGSIASYGPDYPTSTGYNASVALGWNGPYVFTGQGVYPGMSATAASSGFASGGAFGTNGDPTPLDAWGNPIVLVPIQDVTTGGASEGQYYYVLISAGSTGTLGPAVAAYGATAPSNGQTVQQQQYPPAVPPSPYNGAPIWAVTTPLTATVTASSSSATPGSGNLNNTSYGPTLTTTSDNTTYQYWLPLK